MINIKYSRPVVHILQLLFLVLTCCVNAHGSPPKTLTFTNYDETLEVRPVDKQQGFFNLGKDRNELIQLRSQFVVKMEKSADTEVLEKEDLIENITPIYEGVNFDFYRVSMHSKEGHFPVTQEQYSLLNSFPDVLYVQPDILQLKGLQSSVEDAKVNAGDIKPLPPLLREIKSLKLNKKLTSARIAIIDNGVSLKHPVLQNIDVAFQYDVLTQTLDASPKYPHELHGTKIAGVLLARAPENPYLGIASGNKLIALRQPDSWLSNTILSFHLANLAGADVILCSWSTRRLLQPIDDIVTELSNFGRDGKGTIVVFAAGNDGKQVTQNSTEAAIEDAIVVGASDYQQKRLNYSNFGETVDINAFGLPIMSTVPGGQYDRFAGTSLSATVVSGYVALLLSQQPDLRRDEIEQKLKTTFNKKD